MPDSTVSSTSTVSTFSELPLRPHLDHLKKQARTLLRGRLALDAAAEARFAAFDVAPERPKLADALHVIARELIGKGTP